MSSHADRCPQCHRSPGARTKVRQTYRHGVTARMTTTREQLTNTSVVAASRSPVAAFGRATRPSQSTFQADSNSSTGISLTGYDCPAVVHASADQADVVGHLPGVSGSRGVAGRGGAAARAATPATVAHTLAVAAGYAYSDAATVSMMLARMGLQDNHCWSFSSSASKIGSGSSIRDLISIRTRGHEEVFHHQLQLISPHHFDIAHILPREFRHGNIQHIQVMFTDKIKQQIERSLKCVEKYFQRIWRDIQIRRQFGQRFTADIRH